MKIHQVLPCLSYGDAIGNHTLEIQRILRRWGYESSIFADDIHEAMRPFAKSYTRLKGRELRDAVLMYHFSVGSPVSDFVKALPNRKILIYHNITPGDFFRGYEESIRDVLEQGRKELLDFVDLCETAVGDSEFNRLELEALGFPHSSVLPIILDFDKYTRQPDKKVLERYQDGQRNIIFVGRLAPNKRQEDIIHAFALYKRYVNSASRLLLIGAGGIERYDLMLDEFIRGLALDDVHITGRVSDDELAAYYQVADLLLCMSEHEGFCVPMVEAMYSDLPILACHSTSIPYTLGESGVLIHEKCYEKIAEMIDLMIENQAFRQGILKAQRRRFSYFKRDHVEQILKRVLAQLGL
ncbi:glycosyltransferase [candidate division KSB3 bacterium]|uniref:Glycosyltransferase n=1 Tax=candidate division KSB3 bacterium TaxID=2044937 RepID=A0A2G6E1P5_9BACT|nr:MAG: glycosyltransferase [candidate division KSB3 bacterium]PIE28627.1 MAG: glycosyltransferase [candidate division KSB3 bacterium]